MVKNEMIERVAKAIESEMGGKSTAMARAAIEAMREPTDEMVEAAVSEFTFHATRPWPGTTPQSIQKDVFRRAIKAALSEGDA